MAGFQQTELVDIDRQISSVESALIQILLYFDIFNHPLKASEIAEYSEFGEEKLSMVIATLERLEANGFIQSKDDYYFINLNESCVTRRISGEKFALHSLKKAMFYTGIIARFPFVKGVLLSGSISKFYMDKEADIDYFVITSPRRMWICRTALVLFKKVFLLNSKKYFCVNYFVTEESLTIAHKNIFTATELAFLIPTYGQKQYHQLMQANDWYRKYYPKISLRDKKWIVNQNKYFFKSLIEKFLSGKIGERLDNYFFRFTLKHWKKKFSNFDEDTFDLRLRSRKNESKHHPLGYQERILKGFSEKMAEFEMKHSVKLKR